MSQGASVRLSRRDVDPVLVAFATEVGPDDPVCVVGGRTQWEVGGLPAAGVREATPPAGVVSHLPAEMIVRVRAGTAVGVLRDTLAEAGQMVPIDPQLPERATVGGVLAVGRSGLRRLRYGPVRDTVLEMRFVTAEGRLVTAGGPVVKNVTGFDLCRLLVGSLGTLGLVAEVVLRCQPLPAAAQWYQATAGADPFDLYRRLFRPSAILWDGCSTWVLLEGHPADVADQAQRVLGAGFDEVAGPPPVPAGARRSWPPGRLAKLRAAPPRWLAEVGVGTVHFEDPNPAAVPEPARSDPAGGRRSSELQAAVKARFDPTGRLNPGRRLP